MTISALLKQGAHFLDGRENALLESEVLLSHVLGKSKEYLITDSDSEVAIGLNDLFLSYLERLKRGEPLAYIIQQKEFFGFDFYVDERVLIPRPETEQLVELALGYLDGSGKVVDVGTGSGAIAISIAKECPGAEVLAVDVSGEALEVANLNAEQMGVEGKVHFVVSDLLEVLDNDEKFDVIVANLPYIGEVRNRFVSDETLEHEPNVALFGGEGGLELYKKMFEDVVSRNIGFGLMLGEFGFSQSDEMSEILDEFFPGKWEVKKDLAGIDRLFVINMLK